MSELTVYPIFSKKDQNSPKRNNISYDCNKWAENSLFAPLVAKEILKKNVFW